MIQNLETILLKKLTNKAEQDVDEPKKPNFGDEDHSVAKRNSSLDIDGSKHGDKTGKFDRIDNIIHIIISVQKC